MKRWTRAAGVVALVAGLVVTGAGAEAQTEGASQSNFVIDVVVVGTPPPGASITIEAPNSQFDQYPFALADAAGPDDVVVVSGTIFRQVFVLPANNAGASAVTYACTMEGGPVVEPFSECHADAVPHDAAGVAHVDASFQGNAPAIARTTITLYFASCAGQPATVVLEAGEKPTIGDDVIVGTPDGDVVRAKAGNDLICTLGWPDHVNGGPGNDRVYTGPGQDSVYAGAGADRVYGGDQGDQLSGLTGNDVLFGQAGNDTIDGQEGTDVCDGGAGRDVPRSDCETRRNFP